MVSVFFSIPHVLKDLGGWTTLKMVMRYAHMGTEHLREWVDKPAVITGAFAKSA